MVPSLSHSIANFPPRNPNAEHRITVRRKDGKAKGQMQKRLRRKEDRPASFSVTSTGGRSHMQPGTASSLASGKTGRGSTHSVPRQRDETDGHRRERQHCSKPQSNT